jgi:hypothetical protein
LSAGAIVTRAQLECPLRVCVLSVPRCTPEASTFLKGVCSNDPTSAGEGRHAKLEKTPFLNRAYSNCLEFQLILFSNTRARAPFRSARAPGRRLDARGRAPSAK